MPAAAASHPPARFFGPCFQLPITVFLFVLTLHVVRETRMFQRRYGRSHRLAGLALMCWLVIGFNQLHFPPGETPVVDVRPPSVHCASASDASATPPACMRHTTSAATAPSVSPASSPSMSPMRTLPPLPERPLLFPAPTLLPTRRSSPSMSSSARWVLSPRSPLGQTSSTGGSEMRPQGRSPKKRP